MVVGLNTGLDLRTYCPFTGRETLLHRDSPATVRIARSAQMVAGQVLSSRGSAAVAKTKNREGHIQMSRRERSNYPGNGRG